MKQLSFIFLALLLSTSLNAQEIEVKAKKQQIGISYMSLGTNGMYTTNTMIGGPSIKAENFFGFGAHYIRELNKTFDLELGLEYMQHKFSVGTDYQLSEGAVFPGGVYREEKVSLVNIPITVRANFLNYFFVNGGPILDFDYGLDNTFDNQNGVGLLLGAGVNYEFNNGLSLFLNPNLKMHSLIPFDDGKDRISESSLRFGVSYSLK